MTREQRRRTLAGHFLDVITSLLEQGSSYAELSVQQLITAAGVSRGTFYVYFDDSYDLLASMAKLVVDTLFDAGRSWWAFSGRGTKDDLREALRPAFDVYQDHRAILVSVAEGAPGDEQVRAQHRRLVDGVIDALADHIQHNQVQGLATPELNPRRCAQWLAWMLERGLHQLASQASPEELKELLDALTEIVWHTVYASHRAGQPAIDLSGTD